MKFAFLSEERRKSHFFHLDFKTNHIFRFLMENCIRIRRTRRHLTNFIGSTRPLSNALEKHTLRKNQPQSWNEPEWWH